MDSVDLTDDAIVDVSKTRHLKYFLVLSDNNRPFYSCRLIEWQRSWS